MSYNNQPGKKFSLIFNILFFAVVLGVIGVSLFIVFENMVPGMDSPPDGNAGENQSEPEYVATSDQEGALIETTIEVPPDEMVTTKYLGLMDSLVINPGIGWVYRWSARRSSEIPSTVAYGERGDVSWRILNPAEDRYNWAPLDAQLQDAVSRGQQFSFRVYTMVGESYGSHQVPQWVIENGALILENGEPDYSNCVYQDAWGRFVNELVKRYDGNPQIAFIDVSGYGDFNEWSWNDQTVWDYSWEEHYNQGSASQFTFSTIDGQARRRLADMFIGGGFTDHTCQTNINEPRFVNYDYPGFQITQLVMPYAGTIQSTQYVFTQRQDVGFRHDCLGRAGSEDIPDRLGYELAVIHQQAPIVFETCSEYSFELQSAFRLLSKMPASLIHNANIPWLETEDIASLTKNLGYRYTLSEVIHTKIISAGETLYLKMAWSNLGNSPNYPAMGQDFRLHVYIVPRDGGETLDLVLNTDITGWSPSDQPGLVLPIVNEVEKSIQLPDDLDAGVYDLRVAIINLRTGNSILLANNGRMVDDRYQISELEIINE